MTATQQLGSSPSAPSPGSYPSRWETSPCRPCPPFQLCSHPSTCLCSCTYSSYITETCLASIQYTSIRFFLQLLSSYLKLYRNKTYYEHNRGPHSCHILENEESCMHAHVVSIVRYTGRVQCIRTQKYATRGSVWPLSKYICKTKLLMIRIHNVDEEFIMCTVFITLTTLCKSTVSHCEIVFKERPHYE